MDLQHMSVEERLQLMEEIWDSLSVERDALELTPEQMDELDRRLAEFERDGDQGVPAREAIERLRASL